MNNGYFIVSLDFELMWGVQEKYSIAEYGDAILAVHSALPKMLDIFDRHGVKSTIAAVGFLFLNNKDELLAHIPPILPQYKNAKISPYGAYINSISDKLDPRYNFAPKIIEEIKRRPQHELCTHTLTHYNVGASGQTIESFRADLETAIKIADKNGVKFSSIIFPRNQFNAAYLEVCKEFGISVYRGKDRYDKNKKLHAIDRYIPIFNDRPYQLSEICARPLMNVRGSEHWKPNVRSKYFWGKVSACFRLKRVKRSMLYAAQKGLVYHIWWHPHEFGRFSETKLEFLEELCAYYAELRDRYGLASATMNEAAAIAIKQFGENREQTA